MILKRKPKKAYYAHEKDGDFATVVFAENATQAKVIASACDCCEDARYIDIRVRRFPKRTRCTRGSRRSTGTTPTSAL